MRSTRMRVGAVGTAVVMGGVALTGCGNDSGTDSGRSAPSSSPSDGHAQEQGTTAVRSAYDKTAEAGTAKMKVEVKVGANGKSITTDGKGAIDLDEGDSAMTLAVGNKTVEQRVVDQVLYQKLPDSKSSGDKPWTKVDLKKAAERQGMNPQQVGDPAQSVAYAKAITDKDVSKAGTEKIDGVNTTEYKVSVDVSELPGGAGLQDQLGPTLPMRIWLDDQGRIRRQQVDLTTKASASAQSGSDASSERVKISTTMQFSDFGTEVDVKAPSAAEVTDATDRLPQSGQGQE